ncbi:MAG TPA: 5'-3' exonuclease H3TH domain-containing protein [Candidatus Binataceae bacterium]|nr:5'-3' exonuclease H3TH domain-containing protein [Candidatus Binataceae bacterium]
MRLHLIDGTYELYRAHFAPRPGHLDARGRDMKATVGIVASLLALLHDSNEAVTHIAVAFDNPIRSFRNDLYAGYKSDDGVPPELRSQFDTAEDAVRAIGIAVWSMREYEADDGLASGARCFRDQVEQVRIMTPDKDLGQCLRGDRVVQVDRRQQKVIDESVFRAERGFGPESMPDFLALSGDSADGFPGLPGFGKKTASLLIGAYEHLENIPNDANQWRVKLRGAPQLAATLAEHRADALLYRKLATLVDTVDLRCSLDDLEFRGVPPDRYERWCDELAVERLKTVPRRWLKD